ncbi:MAG: hypothetical protein Q9P01_12730 [Anaerolineae bacterium]|nr:hypothetical protein [Anaerolineae bacterium]MDQ7035658.1 hypothetical protein [Anaerolineae bacterium]
MQPKHIYPEYALILTYNVRLGTQERYFRYITGELYPALERRELYMQNAWLIVYGQQPQRQIEFIAERLDPIRDLLDDPEWERLENRLKEYTEDYERHVIRYRHHVKILRLNYSSN